MKGQPIIVMKVIDYDLIANDYDNLVKEDVENFRFPYSEYNLLQEIIIEYILDNPKGKKSKILDIGIGTASLYERINPDQIELTGIDNSFEMLEIAKLKVPEAKLINHNIKKGLPKEVNEEKYDFIVVSYLFMHFDFEFIVYFIDLFRKRLAPFGKLLIGDIMFYNENNKIKCFRENPNICKHDLYFHVYEDILERLEDNYDLSFMEINQYTGLVIVEKLYQNSLQYEETLIEYNGNTEKWKSTHPEKKSE